VTELRLETAVPLLQVSGPLMYPAYFGLANIQPSAALHLFALQSYLSARLKYKYSARSSH